uniref:NADH dehydrogenase subunit 5 n=1 Tax=Bolbosoma nipponicum TaxID=1167864 RepID=UPI002E796DAA|nr:NADH dehydrogenase subunit 5 [Bolbosoma nipponicum]WPN89835.1 NADH dehydrogenase subunit 5 [Bolbosoma nipponicum]
MVGVLSGVFSLTGLLIWAMVSVVVYSLWVGVFLSWGMVGVTDEIYGFSYLFGDKGYVMVGVLVIVYLMVSLFGSYYMSSGMSGSFSWLVMLFVGGVIVMLLSGGLYNLLVGWEILGVVSFILIGYYCTRSSWGSALTTVLINRVGDVGLVLLFWGLWLLCGVLWGFDVLCLWLCGVMVSACVLTKSAQSPFGCWLPLAMAAPTPVSALVHSSTLVIAGLFVCWFMEEALGPVLIFVLGLMGVATLLSAGLSSVCEMDFKKVVAYSTSMHLGLMLCMAFWVGWMFMGVHMELHAFFKSLLFIGVGFVIMIVCHDQDYRGFSMGGVAGGVVGVFILSSLLSLIGWTYFSGWFTKDGFMEYLVFQSLGLIVWLVVMAGLATSGVYSFKLLVSVMSDSLVKMPLVLDWVGLKGLMVGVVCAGSIMGSVLGLVCGLWVNWGVSVCVLGVSEKFMFWCLVLSVAIVWFLVGRYFVGSGFSVYIQGMYQYLLAVFSYFVFSAVQGFENCWLLGLVDGVLAVFGLLGEYVVSLLSSLDWYLVFMVVLVGLCFGVVF